MKVERISCATGQEGPFSLSHQNWVAAPDVHVNFDLHHRGSSMLLKFWVLEPQVRAVHKGLNSQVWEDSCVEFFLAPRGEDAYYNFEFNAIGTFLAAYGTGREDREAIPGEQATLISATPSLGQGIILNMEGPVRWELDILIPCGALWKHAITDLAGMDFRGNLYKCGDGLKQPHYLSWQAVNSDAPDFHRPECFGEITFGS